MSQDRRYQVVLVLACLLLFAFHLGGRDFWSPDEPRYAGVARSLQETGDFLSLSNNGRPYTDKPPLFFWIVAATARLGSGVNETTARIPSSLFGLLCVLLTYRLGRLLYGPRLGLLAGLVLATSQRFFLEARWVHIDMLLCLLMVLGMDAAFRALVRQETWRWGMVYAAMGLGCLAKGPVAVVLPMAGLMTFLASRRELKRVWQGAWLWLLPLTFLPTLAWLWLASGDKWMAPLDVIRLQVFDRFREGVHHPRPFYYYLYSLPITFFPWSLFLVGAVKETFPFPGRKDHESLLFLYSWILGGLVLLSLSVEKRPAYLLPLFPPLAILVARFWEEFLTRWDIGGMRRHLQIPIYLFAAICLIGLLGAAPATSQYSGLSPRLGFLASIYLVTCAGSLAFLRAGKRGWTFLSWTAGLMAGYLWIAGSFMPWLNQHKSARPFSERVVATVGSARLGVYHDDHPGLGYYTRRRLPILRTLQELESFLTSGPGGYIVMEEAEFEKIKDEIPVRELDREAIGHRTLILLDSGT